MQIDCELDCGCCRLRPMTEGDLVSVARHANNPRVAAHLRDRFPSPYTLDDARHFLDYVSASHDECVAAISVGEEAVGVIGLLLRSDIERCSSELGYWIGETFWGRGIASASIATFTDWAMPKYSLTRVYAEVFAENPASARVLEKCGFERIGLLRKAAIKRGHHRNYLLFDLVR